MEGSIMQFNTLLGPGHAAISRNDCVGGGGTLAN